MSFRVSWIKSTIIISERSSSIAIYWHKFREPQHIDWEYNFEIMMDSFEKYTRTWVKREEVELDILSEWVKSSRSLMLRRIHKLKFYMNARPKHYRRIKREMFYDKGVFVLFSLQMWCTWKPDLLQKKNCYCLHINITKDLRISNDSGNPVDQNTSFDEKEMFRKSYGINVINEYSD